MHEQVGRDHVEHHEYKRCDQPYYKDADTGDPGVIVKLHLLFGNGYGYLGGGVIFCKKVINGNAEKLRDAFKHGNVGDGFASFPFGHGLVRVVQLLCKLGLSHACLSAKRTDIVCYYLFQFHLSSPCASQKATRTKFYVKNDGLYIVFFMP